MGCSQMHMRQGFRYVTKWKQAMFYFLSSQTCEISCRAVNNLSMVSSKVLHRNSTKTITIVLTKLSHLSLLLIVYDNGSFILCRHIPKPAEIQLLKTQKFITGLIDAPGTAFELICSLRGQAWASWCISYFSKSTNGTFQRKINVLWTLIDES